MNVIIIEDEKPAARLLQRKLQKLNIQADTMLHSVEEAIQWFGKNEQPDLILLDIQLSDGLSFEIFETIPVNSAVIFTTAYEQYAIKAFETFSIDYLLKPIKEERLEQSLEKLKQFGRLNPSINIAGLQDIIRQFQAPSKPTALTIKTGDRIILLRFENIVYLEAEDKYVFVYTADGQKHLTDLSLSFLSEKLPAQFCRIQKSYIINKEKIKEMHRHFNGRYLFVMEDKTGTRLTSGRTYHEELKAEFGL